MLIKITFPIRIGERVIQPGETIDVSAAEAALYLDNEWAAKVAEVKDDNRKKRTKVQSRVR
jgi:hypothetical protein